MIRYNSSAAQATTGVVHPVCNRLHNVKCTNLGAAAAFLQVFNRATVLAGGEVPFFVCPVPAGGLASLDNFYLDTGCVCALSSTAATYTPYGNGWFYVELTSGQ